MSEVRIQRLGDDYRGASGGIEIFLPSRSVQLPGKRRLIKPVWYLIMGYMAFYGLAYWYIRSGAVDGEVGSIILLVMIGPLVMLAGGGGFRAGPDGRREYIAPRDVHLPEAGVAPGKRLGRPNQRLVLGPKCSRQSYEDKSIGRTNSQFTVQPHSRLEVRDDDGEDDGIHHMAAFWLVHDASGDERLLLEGVASDERDEVLAALREGLEALDSAQQ